MMNDRKTIHALLEENLRRFARLGVQRQLDDVEAYLRYRDGLTPDERDRFDDLIKAGAFPGAAAESVEIISGRLKPHSAQEEAAVLPSSVK